MAYDGSYSAREANRLTDRDTDAEAEVSADTAIGFVRGRALSCFRCSRLRKGESVHSSMTHTGVDCDGAG